jgi:predicted nucleotidyltransferase
MIYSNAYRVLKVFLDSPTYEFGLREISRKINLALPSVKKYLSELESQGFIRKEIKKKLPVYYAERDYEKFKFYKKLDMQSLLFESGVIDFIWKKLSPEAIIFYGSCAKGDSVEDSDIDLFAIGKKLSISLDKYEDKIGKKIHLIIDELDNIPKELKNNLSNGVVMRGYFRILR